MKRAGEGGCEGRGWKVHLDGEAGRKVANGAVCLRY
jgi:hypothetical protein